MSSAPTMSYLAAHLHRLSIEALLRAEADPAEDLAVVQGTRIVRAGRTALQAGIEAGQSCATARAISPGIRLLERDLTREAEALRQLACCALRFTPQLSLIEPGPVVDRAGMILEIGRSLRLFGGADSIRQQLGGDLRQLGFSARLCQAPTPTGAWLLALRHERLLISEPERLVQLLSRLPLELLASCGPHQEALQAAGLQTIGQLLQLPRASLARRFGPALLEELDRALGERPDPRPLFEPPARFDAELELAARVEQAEQLLFAARRLVLQLCGWLQAREAGALRLDLIARSDDRPPRETVVSLRLERASRDPEHLSMLLREHLQQRCRLQAPALYLRLRCEWIGACQTVSDDLFPDARHADAEWIDRLVERLQARLGREQVLRLRAAADHRPEFASSAVPLGAANGSRASGSGNRQAVSNGRPLPSIQGRGRSARPMQHETSTGTTATCDSERASVRPHTSGREPHGSTGAQHRLGPAAKIAGAHVWPLPRPLWLVEPPVAIGERNNRPYLDGPLSLLAGPERIETGWWDPTLTQRDYFIAEDSAHRLLWIFRIRHPHPDARGAGPGWFLHGRYG
jgi:protein ImuB